MEIDFTDGSTQTYAMDPAASGSNSNEDTAEFIGVVRVNGARILGARFDSSGDDLWGLDNVEYGVADELYLQATWSQDEGGNGHTYRIYLNPSITWFDAREAAESTGGYLASLTGAAENDFVALLVDESDVWRDGGNGFYFGPWIGGFKSDLSVVPLTEGWEWTSGEIFSFASWLSGEPNNASSDESALHYFSSVVGAPESSWNDQSPYDPRVIAYVVEYDVNPDLDSDGVDNIDDNCINIANASQFDSDGDGYGNACDADLNNDCVINVQDLGLLRQSFFSAGPDADFNGDGVVNAIDLGVLRASFFSAPGPSGLADFCGG